MFIDKMYFIEKDHKHLVVGVLVLFGVTLTIGEILIFSHYFYKKLSITFNRVEPEVNIRN